MLNKYRESTRRLRKNGNNCTKLVPQYSDLCLQWICSLSSLTLKCLIYGYITRYISGSKETYSTSKTMPTNPAQVVFTSILKTFIFFRCDIHQIHFAKKVLNFRVKVDTFFSFPILQKRPLSKFQDIPTLLDFHVLQSLKMWKTLP